MIVMASVKSRLVPPLLTQDLADLGAVNPPVCFRASRRRKLVARTPAASQKWRNRQEKRNVKFKKAKGSLEIHGALTFL
jgi:hypothetical protein